MRARSGLWILRRIAAASIALALGVSTAGAAETPAYVGVAACSGCHEKQYKAWLGSHHEKAMQPASARTVLGNFAGGSYSDADVDARFSKQGDRFVVHTAGPDGAPADFDVAYTFGIEPLQQYLIPFPRGRLQSLTIAWDTRPKADGGQRWFNLYPNEKIPASDPLHWTGAEQNWNYMCADCHSTHLQKRYDAATDTYDTKWVDVDVACEACHGPGAVHVGWAQAKAKGESAASGGDGLVVHFPSAQIEPWPLNAATSSARPRPEPAARDEIETCAPCHMRRSVIGEGRVPGQPLLDTYLPALLVDGLYHADGQIEGEVYEYGSFLQSKMYRSGVTCRNCHEPHSLALRSPGDAVCSQCHLRAKYATKAHHFHPPGSSGASCVGCHMPTTTYMIVDPRHDHSLRVPRPDLSVALGTPNACNKCHADRDAGWARDQVRAWYGHDASGYQTFATALHAGRAGLPSAAAALPALVRDEGQPAIARATALTLIPGNPGPDSMAALKLGVADSQALVRWAAVDALRVLPPPQRLPLAAPLLDDPVRAVRIEAARALANVPPQTAGAALGEKIGRGLAEYVAAQQIDADRPESHTNLCTLLGELGQWEAAEAECRAATRLRPSYTPAYVNLADLYRTRGRDDEGEKILRAGIAVRPDDAALHHALGLSLVRQKKEGEALAELQRAAEILPEEARYSYVLGVGLNSVGKTDQALAVLQKAQARHPNDRDILIALATMNRDSGHMSEAREYARKLAALSPDDPSTRQLVQQLEAAQP